MVVWGIGLEELKHFVTNYKQYCDVNRHAYIPAYLCIFGYKIPININDEEIAAKAHRRGHDQGLYADTQDNSNSDH